MRCAKPASRWKIELFGVLVADDTYTPSSVKKFRVSLVVDKQ